MMQNFPGRQLDVLEAESVQIMWETAAQFSNPVIFFSGGKDSITLVNLARRAFFPAKIPFRLLHVDTGHNFPEVLKYRDDMVLKFGLDIVIRKVSDTISKKNLNDPQGKSNW